MKHSKRSRATNQENKQSSSSQPLSQASEPISHNSTDLVTSVKSSSSTNLNHTSQKVKIHSLLLALCSFIGSIIGYYLTYARTVTLVDSGELIVVANSLGVAHPPGFPLYTLLGNIFSKLPFGNPASRISFMSSFFAAFTVAFLTLIIYEIYQLLDQSDHLSSRKKKVAEIEQATFSTTVSVLLQFLPLAISLSFGFSATFWLYACVAEVYTLNIALLSVIVYLMLKWYKLYADKNQKREEVEKSARSLLLFASLVYGLALGVHHVTILLTFPAIFVLVYLTVGKEYIFSKRLLLLFVALFIGLSIYIYLPFAASRETIINWGNPKTFANFYDHISGKQYQVNLFSSGMDKVSEELSQFLRIIFQEFTPVGLLVGLFGFFAVWQREKRLFWFVTLIIFFDLAYSFNYDIAEDKDAYYLITHFAFTLVIAVGARYMLDVASRKNGLALLSLLVLLLLLPCLNFYIHYFRNNRSNYTIAYDYVKNSLSSIEEGGLLLTADWQMYSPYLYMRHLENFRKDATVIDTNLLRRSWYVEIYLKREYPEMMKACANEVEAYMKDLRLFEQDLPYDIPAINRNYFAMVEAFIKFHTPKHSAHITLPIDDGVGRNYTWVPQGLTMLLSSSKEFIPSYPNIDLKSISDSSQYIDQVAEEKVVPRYSMMFINRGRYLNLHNKNDEALKFIELAIRLEPERDAAYEALGDVYTAMGNQTEALKAYRNALEINPNNREVIKKLQRQ